MGALLVLVIWATPPTAPAASVHLPPATAWVDLTLAYAREKVTLVEATRGRFAGPTALTRYRGRFEVRLVHGSKIIERVRFDFPLLAGTESEDATPEARALAAQLRAGVSARTRVRVPLYDGVDGLVVFDPITARTLELPVPRAGANALVSAPAPSPAASPAARAGAPHAP